MTFIWATGFFSDPGGTFRTSPGSGSLSLLLPGQGNWNAAPDSVLGGVVPETGGGKITVADQVMEILDHPKDGCS